MPRADFYLIGKPRFRDEPLLLVCELARKAHDAGLWTLVLARDAAQAEAIDDLLWAFDDDAYIPHQVAGQDDEDELAPVLIAAPGTDAPSGASSRRLISSGRSGTSVPGAAINTGARSSSSSCPATWCGM